MTDYLAFAACVLAGMDAGQSVQLQSTGKYIEKGLPSLIFGPHPKAWQLYLSSLVGCMVLLTFGELVLGHTLRLALYLIWITVEGYEVVRNWRLIIHE